MTAASRCAAFALAANMAVLLSSAATAAGPTESVVPLAAVDSARMLAAEGNSEWLSHGRTYSEQRFSPLQQINAGNVKQLGLAWYAQFDTDRGMEATPLMVDGVLFTTTSWSKVHALDARTGKLKWSYDPKVDGQKGMDACCDVVNRGVALWQGRVYVGALDGRLIALDAGTGKEVWSQQTTDTRWPYTITGAPRVVKDKVIIGNGGAELGVRGYVSAYDAATGKLAWRFYTTPNPQGLPDHAASDRILAQHAAGTWYGTGWKRTGGGGTAWDAIVYDPVTDLVYVGVGNGSPWSHQARSDGKGDNLFLSSIVALHADTGDYAWHYQTTPGDSWDYTAVQPIMTADLDIGGARRHVVMQAPKNGFFYVLDAASGKFISAEKFVPVNWAERVDIATGRPVENPSARYPDGKRVMVHSGPAGAHSWHPMSFDPGAGLVFIPAMVSSFPYQNDPGWKFVRGRWNVAQGAGLGSPAVSPPGGAAALQLDNPGSAQLSSAVGQLIAWDPVAQKARWKQTQDASFGGTLATAGGLVFAATGRDFNAYASANGTKLWSQRAAAPIIAAPMTYALDGDQYVAVSVGYGGVPGVASGSEPRRPGRLQVYKLGGTASAPEFEPFVPRPRLDVAAATPSRGNSARGAQHYATLCATCHTSSGIFFPNLPTSPYVLAPASFKSVVHDGALRARGMANFSAFLSEQDVEDVRAYLLVEAGKPPAQPAENKPIAASSPQRRTAGW